MKFILIFFIAVSSCACYGATVTWNGLAGDKLWTTDGNWDTNEAPKFNDDVVISGSSSVGGVIVSDEVFCKSLTLFVSGELHILSTGAIEIEGSSDRGVDIFNSALKNDGFLIIRDAQGTGIEQSSGGTLINNNVIIIENVNISGGSNKHGILARGDTITNSSGAKIMITSVNGAGTSQYGISLENLTVLNNLGDLEIANTDSGGIKSCCKLNNQGNITLSSLNDRGMSLSGTTNNEVTGKIIINNNGESGIFLTSGILNNTGNVEINQTVSTAIAFSDSIVNSGSITLFDGDIDGMHGFGNSVVINEGQISIEKFKSDGIDNGGTFINEGKTIIKNIDGLGIENTGLLMIKDSLIIQNATERGFRNKDSLIIYNGAYISIYQCGRTDNSQVLINNGVIDLDECSEGCLFNTGKLCNNQDINIDNAADRGLENRGELYNGVNGTISINNNINDAAVYNLVGLLENKGLITSQNSNQGLFNSALFINEDSLMISTSNNQGILNADTLINMTGATIVIEGISGMSGSSGFASSGIDSYTVIDGVLEISNTIEFGIFIQGSLSCGATGHISTSNIDLDPFTVVNWDMVIINGEIDIGN